MKHNMKWATLVVAGAAMMFACKSENGNANGEFQPLSEGLTYKVEQANPDGQQVQEGDVLVGEMTVTFEDSVIYDTKGEVKRVATANPGWEGKVGEGLLKMHVGEIYTFALDADTIAKYLDNDQMPANYQPGKGQKCYYKINLQDIVTRDEILQEQANWVANMRQMEEAEPELIQDYLEENKITTKPTADGIYVIVKKKGNGPKVTIGKEVTVNYTGRLLDGTMFDSSRESDARTGEIYDSRHKYTPFTFVIGKDQKIIQGWHKGLLNLTAGSEVQLIIPSKQGYGSYCSKDETITPYSPLVFDIEIVSVK